MSNVIARRGRTAVSTVLRLFGLEVQVPCPPEDDSAAPGQQLRQQQRPLVKVQHSFSAYQLKMLQMCMYPQNAGAAWQLAVSLALTRSVSCHCRVPQPWRRATWRSTGSTATWCPLRACAPPTTACWTAGAARDTLALDCGPYWCQWLVVQLSKPTENPRGRLLRKRCIY